MIELPEMPESIAKLPRDSRGYPVPWFVQWIDGQPEFRVMNHHKWVMAAKQRLCWVCGEKLPPGKDVFVIGPMCAVNRVTSEPPCHIECARFSAQACPFLSMPKAKRREANMPEGGSVAGVGIMRNPGVTCLWICNGWKVFDAGNGQLFKLPSPRAVEWWSEGTSATKEQIMESINSGLPILEDAAKIDGSAAERALKLAVAKAMRFVHGA